MAKDNIQQITNKFKPRKYLVLDVNNEFEEPLIGCTPKDIFTFSLQRKVEGRRISVMKTGGKKKSLDESALDLQIILDNFHGGAVLAEDINKFVSDSMSKDLIGNLCTQRHFDCDIIIHYQGLGRAGHPKIVQNMNLLRMHKTGDSAWKNEVGKKFGERLDIIRVAENIVSARYELGNSKCLEIVDPNSKEYKFWDNNFVRFYVYVDFDLDKIFGNFTEKEARSAIRSYIMRDKSVLAPLLDERDENSTDGKKLYDYPTAFKMMADSLYDKYFKQPKTLDLEREPKLCVVVGKKGVGKTYRTKAILKDYVGTSAQM